ncbi:hypothetical protein Tco_1256560 [Tanacetum coccineum]
MGNASTVYVEVVYEHFLESDEWIEYHIFSNFMMGYQKISSSKLVHLKMLKKTRCGQSDHGKARHSISSTSAHHKYGSSSHQGDYDKDDVVSRASTPSPTTYLNSLRPLNYQRYNIPTSSQQDDDLLFERQTVLLNKSQQIHEEVRGGFKSFGKALRGVFGKKKK